MRNLAACTSIFWQSEWWGARLKMPFRLYWKKAMTIDERLERLADRHEALSHTVELLIADAEKAGE